MALNIGRDIEEQELPDLKARAYISSKGQSGIAITCVAGPVSKDHINALKEIIKKNSPIEVLGQEAK